MKVQFTIRHLMILTLDLAIFLALAAMIKRIITRTNNPVYEYGYLILLLYVPVSFIFLIGLFEPPGANRKGLEAMNAVASPFLIFAGGLWSYYGILDKPRRDLLSGAKIPFLTMSILGMAGSIFVLLLPRRFRNWLCHKQRKGGRKS